MLDWVTGYKLGGIKEYASKTMAMHGATKVGITMKHNSENRT